MEARDPVRRLNAPGGRSSTWRQPGLLPALAVLLLLFGGAMLGALRVSLIPLGDSSGELTLDAWSGIFADPSFIDALGFTLKVALIATVISALLALLLALTLRDRGLIAKISGASPVPVPHLLVATIAVLWLAPGGIADRVLGGLPIDPVRDPGGSGVILVYVFKEVPFIALLLLASLGRSVKQREEVARVLGADRRQVFAWVIWPALRAPLLLGSLIVAAFTIGSFEVPLAVGPNYPQTLAGWAFEATRGDLISGESEAAAALLVAGAIAVALAAVSVRFARDVEGG